MIPYFLTIFVFFLILVLGVTTVTQGRRALRMRVFFLPLFGFLVWTSMRLFPLVDPLAKGNDDILAELIYSVALVGSLLIAFGVSMFAYTFPRLRVSRVLLRLRIWGGLVLILSIGALFVSTDLIIAEVSILDHKFAVTPGPGYVVYVSLLTFLYAWMFFTLGNAYGVSKAPEKIALFMGVVFLGLVGPYINDVLPLLFFDSLTLSYWGFLTILFAGPLFIYALLRHQLFDLKLATLDMLLLGMGLALAAVAITSESLLVFGFNLLILCIFGVLAFFLVHELMLERTRRHQIKQANTKLSEAVNAKEQFLRLTSHQLRTPLSAIQGYLDMLLDAPSEEYAYPASTRPHLEKAYLNYQRLNSIVEDISVANKISTGNLHLEPKESFDLREVLLEVCEYNSYLASERNVKLTKNFPQNEIPFQGRQKLLFEALHNLLHNAIIYDSSSIQISLREREDTIVVKIIDDGMGITEEEYELLGERFRRPRRAEHTHPDGLGLGVYIARTIIQTHEGELEIHSQGKEKGSVVTVSFAKNE